MIISFYFSYKTLLSKNILKVKKRLVRLLIPFIFIPVIRCGLIILLLYHKINIKKLLKKLLLQYITGYTIMIPLWYLHILIILFILFEIFFLLFQKKTLILIQILTIFFYWLQYSEFNL